VRAREVPCCLKTQKGPSWSSWASVECHVQAGTNLAFSMVSLLLTMPYTQAVLQVVFTCASPPFEW
jgi:hypothetical protein